MFYERAKNQNGAIAPSRLIRDKTLTPAQKLVWIAIRDREGKNDSAWPSLETIAKDTGMSRKSVFNAIHGRKCGDKKTKGLTDVGWLKMEHSESSNIYECWVVINENDEDSVKVTPVSKLHSAGVKVTPPPVSKLHSNQHNRTNTRTNTLAVCTAETQKAIVQVIKAFKNFNPAVAYENVTQRKAVTELVKIYGLENVLKIITILPEINSRKYAPSIITPRQLLDKWTALKFFLLKEANDPKKRSIKDRMITCL